MSNPSSKPSAAPAPTRPAGKDSADHAHDEDALHVPRGVSRRTFYFLIGLIIFLMVIWLVPGAMLGIAGGSGGNPVVVRFRLPSGETVEWKGVDVQNGQRALQDGLAMDTILAYLLGVEIQNPKPESLTRLLVLDRFAREAGIEVTDADLAGHLNERVRMFGGTAETFRNEVRANGFEQVAVEEAIRRLMRVLRFQQMVGFAGALPAPAKIEELWHRDNEEFAFDYVTLEVASLKDAARAELPDDAALEAWFGKLPEGERAEFKSEERRKAELALFRDGETTPAAELLAAFPEPVPEGTEATAPEELANQYYNRVYATRFAKDPEAATQEGFPGFFTFEEVKPVCLAEAPVFFALQRWIDDLNARRTNGEVLDFAAEAAQHGLELRAEPEARTRAEFALDEGSSEGQSEVADAVFGTAPDGSVYAVPVATKQGLAVVRVNERTEPEMPAFASLRERVAEKWIGPKTEELALARLKTLRDGFERFEPAKEDQPRPQRKKPVHLRASAEAFRSAAEAAGLTVKVRDYLNKATSRDKLPADPEQLVLFNQANAFGLYTLEADEVAEPALGSDQLQAYLVRLAGKREVPLANMSPAQYESYKTGARQAAITEIGQGLDLDFLRANYGLWLLQDQAETPDAKKGS